MKTAILLASAGLLLVSPAFAQNALSLASFSSVSASDGASVNIRHGATQQVTLVRGDLQHSRVEVRDGKLTAVTCMHYCPPNYRLELDVVMPELKSASADDGGNIDAQGEFPAQAELTADANDGGNLDLRAIPAAHAHANAVDGGNIVIRATASLNATADDGGNITYWGNPTVNMRADDGGNVDHAGG